MLMTSCCVLGSDEGRRNKYTNTIKDHQKLSNVVPFVQFLVFFCTFFTIKSMNYVCWPVLKSKILRNQQICTFLRSYEVWGANPENGQKREVLNFSTKHLFWLIFKDTMTFGLLQKCYINGRWLNNCEIIIKHTNIE